MFSYLKINYIDILIKYVTSRRLSEKMTFRNHIYIPLIFIFCFLLSKDVLAANLEIQKMGTEILAYMDGGKRFTFPYVVGTYENLKPLYQEMTDKCIVREQQWRKDAGLL